MYIRKGVGFLCAIAAENKDRCVALFAKDINNVTSDKTTASNNEDVPQGRLLRSRHWRHLRRVAI